MNKKNLRLALPAWATQLLLLVGIGPMLHRLFHNLHSDSIQFPLPFLSKQRMVEPLRP